MNRNCTVVVNLDVVNPCDAIAIAVGLRGLKPKPHVMIPNDLVYASVIQTMPLIPMIDGLGLRIICDARISTITNVERMVKHLDNDKIWGMTVQFTADIAGELVAKKTIENVKPLVYDQGARFGRRVIAHLIPGVSGAVHSDRIKSVSNLRFWGAIVPPYGLEGCVEARTGLKLLVEVNKFSSGSVKLSPKEAREIGADFIIVDASSINKEDPREFISNLFDR